MSDRALVEGPVLRSLGRLREPNPEAMPPERPLRGLPAEDQVTEVGTIVMLYANTGGGHRAAAEAVAGEIGRLGLDGCNVQLVDAAGTSPSRFVRWGARIYGPMTRRAPRLWGGIFHASNSAFAVAVLRRTVLRPSRLASAATDVSLPAVVVSFHPLLTHIAAATPRRGPAMTVVTDMVTIHRSWSSPGVDILVSPSAAASSRLGTYKPAPGVIIEAGLPVSQPFLDVAGSDDPRGQLRRKLGLKPGFTVLLFGGGEGACGLVRQARALLTRCPDLTVAAICGRNTTAQARLDKMATGSEGRLVVHGFVDNVEEWMAASDVVATKAGPGAIAEALVCGKPLLLTAHLPGQERGNAEWVVAHGAGLHVPRIPSLVRAVLDLKEDHLLLATMAARAADLARPDASATVAQLVLSAASQAAATTHP